MEMRYWARGEGDRIFVDNRILCRTDNEELTGHLKREFEDVQGEWFGELFYLRKLENLLKNYGYEISNYAPFFNPSRTKEIPKEHESHLTFYYGDEIKQFKEDERFQESFLYGDIDPDKIGVSYQIGDTIVGMAGANYNGKYVWEIGIEVFDGYRGQGLAPVLVSAITNRIVKENNGGIIPTYGTRFTHTKSMNVAIRSGYKIGWTELMIKKKEHHK
ncbi:MAG: GNAT family N-acetyltransferase [Tissierella sp.]|nr:GNAT family N-acetyltransferase [Tissierella sp.]